jgi:hypothetical protein
MKYNMRKGSGSVQWTAQLIPGDEVPDDELTARVVAISGLTAEQIHKAVDAFCTASGEFNAEGRPIRSYRGKVNCIPGGGGNFASPDDAATAETANVRMNMSMTEEFIAAWRAPIAMEKMGVRGHVEPSIEAVVNKANGVSNRYTPGNVLEIRGEYLLFPQNESQMGVMFTNPTNGTKVQASVYALVTSGTILVVVPTGLTGQQRLSVVAEVNGAMREGVFGTLLAHV